MCRLPPGMCGVVADHRKRREIARLDPARLEHHPLRHTIITVILLATLVAAVATFLGHRADAPNCRGLTTTTCAPGTETPFHAIAASFGSSSSHTRPVKPTGSGLPGITPI